MSDNFSELDDRREKEEQAEFVTKKPTPATKTKASLLSRILGTLFTQVLAILIFVGIPALVTAIAPVSWIKFERQNGQVTATAKTCLLFFVPYKTATVSPVIGIGDRVHAGQVNRHRRPGPDRQVKAEDEGFLAIHGNDTSAEVQVSPASLKAVVDQVDTFLKNDQAPELRLFVVTNWKFSIIGGGLISLLTVLYVVGVTCEILTRIVHVFQWGMGIPPEKWLFAGMYAKRRAGKL